LQGRNKKPSRHINGVRKNEKLKVQYLKQIPQIANDNKTTERRDCGSRKYLQITAVFLRIKKLIKLSIIYENDCKGAFQREGMDLLEY
jgi:hypothetical protein